jgi:hypothetical protein
MLKSYEHTGTVVTRFKDVPFDEVKGCHTPGDEEDRLRWEQENRGRSITIFVPPIPEELVSKGFVYENNGVMCIVGPTPMCPSGCCGPFYGIFGFEGTVCRHLVEIGD